MICSQQSLSLTSVLAEDTQKSGSTKGDKNFERPFPGKWLPEAAGVATIPVGGHCPSGPKLLLGI